MSVLLGSCCKAQSPVLPLYESRFDFPGANAYYKDVDHYHDQFVGTWIWANGNSVLKVVFKKLDAYYDEIPPVPCFEDYLVGEYQYIENGIEKVNTLNLLEGPHGSVYDYNLVSRIRIVKAWYPKCNACAEGELRLVMSFNEPSRKNVQGLSADFIIRKRVENGVEKLYAQLKCMSSGYGFLYDNSPTTLDAFTLPCGEYVLVRQP